MKALSRRLGTSGYFLVLSSCLLAFLFVMATSKPAPSRSAAPPKYNVLFIISDDLRPELGAYGVSMIKTPNIDRIAARGTRFDNAYAQYPVCNPSRTSFLTGRYPTQTGVMNNNDYFRLTHPEFVTLPQHFKANGYVTLRTGKIFHGGIDDQVSWTEGGEPTNPGITERGKTPAKQPVEKVDEPDNEPKDKPLSKASASDRIIVLPGNGQNHGDYKTASRAITYLDTYKNQPFFLAVGFVKPHSPPTAPKQFFDLYDVDKMELPIDFGTTPKAPVGFPAISISQTNSDLFIARESTPELSKEMKRAYYASTSFMDAQVGRVMDALERNKLQDNTIVVFFGDHGYHLGEKGKWSKAYSLYELGLRVPLIIAMPKGKGQHSAQVVQLLDLYPTLAELCGLPKPTAIEGHSLSPLLKKTDSQWTYPAYSVTSVQNKLGKSVRTKRWHYVEWEEGKAGSMLFEHPTDPHELKNLADGASYSNTVQEMKKLLKQMPTASK
ncbi:sulfatase [Fibrella aquatica]|uniref:sulfatase n=1 Tax=Fibrella aquatica TaxID=3242487 RepID=UPI003520A0C7